MKKLVCIFGLGFLSIVGFSQVGIGTVNPAAASMLEVSSTSDGGASYLGFMPPRVPTVTARDAINATANDTGLLVFVQSISCLQLWNGIGWESVYCSTVNIVTAAMQDFDSNISWTFTNNPPFYSVGNDIWGDVNDLGTGNTSAIDNISGNFLGCRDLDNTNGGGNFFHSIIFDNVDVSTLTNARIAFDYDVFEFDNGDDVTYEVFFDGIGQGIVTLINGSANLSLEGTEIIIIPNGTTTVSLSLNITQDGDLDFAGFDNFIVYGQ